MRARINSSLIRVTAGLSWLIERMQPKLGCHIRLHCAVSPQANLGNALGCFSHSGSCIVCTTGFRVVRVGLLSGAGALIRIQIAPRMYGSVSMMDLHDGWVKNAVHGLKEGTFVRFGATHLLSPILWQSLISTTTRQIVLPLLGRMCQAQSIQGLFCRT